MRRTTGTSFPFLLSIALVLSTAAVARAQTSAESTPVLTPGDTVRVWAPSQRLDGAMGLFARLDSGAFVMTGAASNPYARGPEVAIPLDPMPRVEVLRRGKRSAGRIMAGILIGAGVGALIGAPMGPIIECGGSCDKEGKLQPMVGPGLGAAIGAGIGGVLGGVVGGMTRARWRAVTITVR